LNLEGINNNNELIHQRTLVDAKLANFAIFFLLQRTVRQKEAFVRKFFLKWVV
jgi:hypothetical protein